MLLWVATAQTQARDFSRLHIVDPLMQLSGCLETLDVDESCADRVDDVVHAVPLVVDGQAGCLRFLERATILVRSLVK